MIKEHQYPSYGSMDTLGLIPRLIAEEAKDRSFEVRLAYQDRSVTVECTDKEWIVLLACVARMVYVGD